MKRVLVVLGISVAALSSFALSDWRRGEREPLWPAGKMPDAQAHQVGAMTDEMKDADFLASPIRTARA